MKRGSDNLKDFSGANPFREAQARTFGEDKIVKEFCPTSIYWSLFNDQHEILLGTRGSGKTMILKMLSYSCVRKYKNDNLSKIFENNYYIGFYIPMHLEFMASLPGKKVPHDKKLRYFQFAFNCAAAKAFLLEVGSLLEDRIKDKKEMFVVENCIADDLNNIWFKSKLVGVSTIKDLQWEIDKLYSTQQFWEDDEKIDFIPFAKDILVPIVEVLPRVNDALRLDKERTSWLACIDETEFVRGDLLKCINTFIRSEKRPLVIKMATLPSKHTTKETTIEGIYIEPNGNDYNYQFVDLQWDSNDFFELTNHICKTRLNRIEFFENVDTLEDFVGSVGLQDDLLDYYRLEMGEENSNEDVILDGILNTISDSRKQRYDCIKYDKNKVSSQYFKKFSPVYYVRKMKNENSRGNRAVGWFAGGNTIRRVADGNPRRFIQIMNHIVENARNIELTSKNQHRIIKEFCKRSFEETEGLPEIGTFVKNILEKIGVLLASRVHGNVMLDGGCKFLISKDLLDDKLFIKAINLSIDYSHIIPEKSKSNEVDLESGLRLSYIHAVHFWLPMRKGSPPVLQSKHLEMKLFESKLESYTESPITRSMASKLIKSLDLEMLERSNEE
jgi:hypothetical protein